MPHFPALRGQLTEQEVVDSFGGYDHRARIRDGAWYETRNLTSDFAPMLASRVRRANTHLAACALLGVHGAARFAMQEAPRDSAQRDWLDPDFGL